jgi:hypothetical protein
MRVIFFTVIPKKEQPVTRYISLLLMIGCVCLGTVLLCWMMLRLVYEMGDDLFAESQKRQRRRQTRVKIAAVHPLGGTPLEDC